MEFTRHDVPETVKVFIDKAIEIGLVDSADVIALVMNFGTNWVKIVDEIIEYAYSNRHHSDEHNVMVPFSDEVHYEEKKV